MSAPLDNIELAIPNPEYVNGYASVAEFIARDRDNTSTIYRRFDRVAARNLLYLQSKLQRLEAIQDNLDGQDLRTNDKESKKAATSWENFISLATMREAEKRRMEIAEEIQKTIKTYRS